MNQKPAQIIFQAILTLSIFSYWAAFALLIVNKLFYKDLPAYTIGRLCIWELVALVVAALIGQLLIRKWGNISLEEVNGQKRFSMPASFAIYFSVYFFYCCSYWHLAILVV